MNKLHLVLATAALIATGAISQVYAHGDVTPQPVDTTGLEVISGGLAPDLRYLEKGKTGDDWFMERIRRGATINGVTKMPAFEGIMSQEAMWAIRAFVESKHEG